jgi:hypothetical protein
MNPYTRPFCRMVIMAYLRRLEGPDCNPQKAFLIRKRWNRIFAYAVAVEPPCGLPARGSYWRRKRSGNVWQVDPYATPWPGCIHIKLCGHRDAESHAFEFFVANFEPEGL